MPTKEGNGYLTGVVWPGLANVNLTEPETTLYEDNCVFLNNTETTITGEFKMPERKMSRKRFKKLLMSKGINRDTAEYACNLIAAHKGTYAWSWINFNIFGFNAMMLLKKGLICE